MGGKREQINDHEKGFEYKISIQSQFTVAVLSFQSQYDLKPETREA